LAAEIAARLRRRSGPPARKRESRPRVAKKGYIKRAQGYIKRAQGYIKRAQGYIKRTRAHQENKGTSREQGHIKRTRAHQENKGTSREQGRIKRAQGMYPRKMVTVEAMHLHISAHVAFGRYIYSIVCMRLHLRLDRECSPTKGPFAPSGLWSLRLAHLVV
jgi:hypothetical protein